MASDAMNRKSVLVTGGAARLGAAVVETFARAGWQVFCHYARSQDLAEALAARLRSEGLQVVPVHGDLSSDEGCQALIAAVGQHTSRLDALVNNASAFEPDSADDFDAAAAGRQLQVNLMAPLSLSKWMAQRLVPEGAPDPACIVHILDQKVFNLNPDYFSYTVSKLALERAVSLQAQALAPAIRVCGVAPGLMYVSGPQSNDNFTWASQANLLRRPVDPLDVARTCLFLAATHGITGSTLSVDNGQHLVPLPRDIMFVVDDLLKGKTT
ncbi:MAG: SDR family oxidoreductase [Comamonadaceae bacterium]|nr:MAG: SDR family oxidoreductase [Comamonadaceae bacterium]